MKPNVAAALCAALVGLLAWSQSAIAEPKTARQCNSDWAANKASIQASGKTKRAFMAECRGVPIAARPSAAPDKSQYAPRPRRTARAMPSSGSIQHRRCTTAVGAAIMARPEPALTCASRIRWRQASAQPRSQGARTPDFLASSVRERSDGATSSTVTIYEDRSPGTASGASLQSYRLPSLPPRAWRR